MKSSNNMDITGGMAEQLEGKEVRTYRLLNPEFRKSIDLRQYEGLIVDAVTSIIPGVKVDVNESSYTVYGINRGEAIRIGRILSHSFGYAAMFRLSLFCSSCEPMFQEE